MIPNKRHSPWGRSVRSLPKTPVNEDTLKSEQIQIERKVYPDRSTAEVVAAKLNRNIDNGVVPGLWLNGRERLIYERAQEIH